MKKFFLTLIFVGLSLSPAWSAADPTFFEYNPASLVEKIGEAEGLRRGALLNDFSFERIPMLYVSLNEQEYLKPIDPEDESKVKSKILELIVDPNLIPSDLKKYAKRDSRNGNIYCHYGVKSAQGNMKVGLYLSSQDLRLCLLGVGSIPSREKLNSEIRRTVNAQGTINAREVFPDAKIAEMNATREKNKEPLIDMGSGPETYLTSFCVAGNPTWARGGKIVLLDTSKNATFSTSAIGIYQRFAK